MASVAHNLGNRLKLLPAKVKSLKPSNLKELTMRNLILLIGLFGATVSQAATQNLYCASGMNSFSAEVTTNGSDSVSIKNAHILGGFIRAHLNCSRDSNITGIKCAGYLNDRILIIGGFDQIEGQPLLFSYQSPTNGSIKSDEPWTCNFP
jgi:hypothetical protein